MDVEPVMQALARLREVPEVLGVSLRSGGLRIYAHQPQKLMAKWRASWPFPDFQLKGERFVRTGHGRCVHRLFAGL